MLWLSHASGQVDSFIHSTRSYDYYINYPIDGKQEYKYGDTVAAVYYDQAGLDSYSTYVINGIVKDMEREGVKVEIFNIRHFTNDGIKYPGEYQVPYACLLKTGHVLWQDSYYWKNITGLHRIQNWKDNFAVGDTLYYNHSATTGFWGSVFGKRTEYRISAIILAIGADSMQDLGLQIFAMEPVYYTGRKSKRRNIELRFNDSYIHRGDTIFTKYRWWFKEGQREYISHSPIPTVMRKGLFCAFSVSGYDCDSNKLKK